MRTILLDYDVLYRRKIDAEGECPHWDYEYPDGSEWTCCITMRRAQDDFRELVRHARRVTGKEKL